MADDFYGASSQENPIFLDGDADFSDDGVSLSVIKEESAVEEDGLKKEADMPKSIKYHAYDEKTEDGSSSLKKKRTLPSSMTSSVTDAVAAAMTIEQGEPAPPLQIHLSESQYKVITRLMSRQSTFFTGAAGTGKSYCVTVLK